MQDYDPPPASMADLIDLDVEPQRVWRSGDMGAVFRHELATPLSLALGDPAFDGGDAEPPAASADGSPLSVAGLLHHPAPPLELLVRLKRFAKAAGRDPNAHLPREVAGVLYALAIAAALLRHGCRITSASDRELAEHFGWSNERPWLDPACHELLFAAARKLGSPNAGQPGPPA